MAEGTDTLTFVNSFAALATRLSADDIAIYSFSWQSLGFGHWDFEAGRRRLRIRVSWDGKDRYLRISTAELASGSTERRWTLVEEHDLRDRRVDIAQLLGSVHSAVKAHAGV